MIKTDKLLLFSKGLGDTVKSYSTLPYVKCDNPFLPTSEVIIQDIFYFFCFFDKGISTFNKWRALFVECKEAFSYQFLLRLTIEENGYIFGYIIPLFIAFLSTMQPLLTKM